ncbi:hypothetical protein RA210_U250040 [Rubrivivax sp. A210]|uniref:hypothetical protein n=1 Tax=Rubrivivax sp. A210 TaxID=2772301 RepID=UPI001918C473|nr:hypothetical protein [Rubrivivax sp. A210]CAD5372941.1 hypothetical protein RA210_U250040 [Rubrivivax sp. A210]
MRKSKKATRFARNPLSRYMRTAVKAVEKFDSGAPGLLQDIMELFSHNPSTDREYTEEEGSRAGSASADLCYAVERWFPAEAAWFGDQDFDDQVAILDKSMYFITRVARRRLCATTAAARSGQSELSPATLASWWQHRTDEPLC